LQEAHDRPLIKGFYSPIIQFDLLKRFKMYSGKYQFPEELAVATVPNPHDQSPADSSHSCSKALCDSAMQRKYRQADRNESSSPVIACE